jgi:iron(III) transport system permease protein
MSQHDKERYFKVKKGFSYLTPLSIGIAAVVAIPIIFTLFSAITVESELWKRLYDTRLKVILPNTIKLLISVGILTLLIGITTAWIVTRYDFKGKKIWEWALILPLAVPGYVLAYAYASIMAPGGIAQGIWSSIFGDVSKMPSLYSFWGVSLILSLVNYPYVYLLTRASLLNQNVKYHEVARTIGMPKWKRLWLIDIRMAYPAIIAGLALALMEVMADFGTVALLRYPTFTEAIYRQMTARFDPKGAAALAFVLVAITFILMNLERYFRGKRSFEQTKGSFKTHIPKKLNLKKTLIVNTLIFLILCFAFFIPVSMLVVMAIEGILKSGFDKRFVQFTLNTLFVSAVGATLASILAVPIAYIHARKKGVLNKGLYYVSSLGYSLPGPVIAVGILLTVATLFNWLYGSILLLFIAYVIRFMPISLQSQDSSISLVSKSMEDASRTLGAGTWKTFKDILLPLIRRGILAGWVVVFVDCMKELPATMMLRPLAFDTLAVRVWMDAAEALWEAAALPALLIVLAGLIPLIIIIKKMGAQNGIKIT